MFRYELGHGALAETKTEYDDLGRPTKVVAAYNSSNEIWVRTEYDDVLRRVITRSDLEVKGDGKKVTIRHFDELGRVRLARAIEDIASEDPTDEEDGIKVQTRYKYDDGANPASSNGVYSLSSNPYRATKSSLANNEETMGWTVNYAPKDGKYSTSESFSGASLPAPFGSNSASTGVVRTDIDANRTLVTDQAGKQRISKTNALGQLTDVWEIKASDSDTETISFPSDSSITHAYKTSYSYDTLNNLTTVNQGQQSRTFTYNSLSRLKSAANPESGTISYIYDENGNLTSKTDARNITTTYLYDNINRVKTRSYNDGVTSTVNYIYDNKANAIGQLTKVSNGISTTEYQVFDKVGRVTQSQQTTDGETYNPMTYKYNLSGAMTEQKYPSGRIVKNVLDNDGMLSMIQSKKDANSGYFNYAKSFTYNATGAVESMQLGNGKWESTTFNSRLQPTQIALGTLQNGTDKLKLNFEYNTIGQNDNNGNVLKQTITVPTVGTNNGFTAVQTYTYDELNRLKSATENIDGNTTASWKQTFTYDRYGNRNFDEDNTTTLTKLCGTAPNFSVCPNDRKAENPSISPINNRIIEDQDNDQVDDYKFDLAGNTTKDVGNKRFTYDGENKQIKVETIDANGNITGTVGEYFYDGDGKRVKKKVGNDITIFVYNSSGQLVAEYATQTSQTSKVSYLTSDHLGSPRITTDMDGDVYTRRDFMPFGEEIDINDTPERKTGLNYASDEIRQKFTTYERDNETELDFAQARMFNYGHARFTSPDPYNPIVKRESSYLSLYAAQPQNWNKFVYCHNNPYRYVDRDGRSPTLATGAIGAVVGAIVGVGIETGRQAIFEDAFDARKIFGAAVQGGIFGGVAGLTGGLSLPAQIAASAGANVAGGIGNRAIRRNPNNPTFSRRGIIIDGLAGGTGGYFAPQGTNIYLSITNASRNESARQVEVLLVSSSVPNTLPTLTRPVVQTAIRNEVYHGYSQKLSNGVIRGGTKTATTGILNVLVDFNLARSVQSSTTSNSNDNTSSSNGNTSEIQLQSGCSSTKDDNGITYQMCGPYIN